MNRSHFQAVLLGAAIGDALGAPVEFDSLATILDHRGPMGVTGFEPWGGHAAGSYTDDTQMTIATAEGTLAAFEAGDLSSSRQAAPYVWRAYLDWRKTQDDPSQRRGPGNTCLTALDAGVMGTPDAPINDSKGCGTIMRIAPCALIYPDDPYSWALTCGAMTHGHPSGYLAGAVFAQILHRIVHGGTLSDALTESLSTVTPAGSDASEVRDVLRRVLAMQAARMPLRERIVEIGQGWVAEEALGVALSCALAEPDDFSRAVLAAVNITGDSDSTGSVTGALMGAVLGLAGIPEELREQVENADLLVRLANDLCEARLARAPKVVATSVRDSVDELTRVIPSTRGITSVVPSEEDARAARAADGKR